MHILSVLLYQTLFICAFVVQSLFAVSSFIPSGLKKFANGSNFTSIVVIDKSLYVGAKNNIFKFDATNIENANSLLFYNNNLPTNSEQKEQCMATYYDEKLCNNFIRTVLHRPNEKDLYACGTYAFMPRLFQFNYDLNLIKEDDGYGFCSLNPLDSSTAIWIENGNPMNIPSLYSASLLDASTKTQPVEPVIYRPELRRDDKSFQYLRTPKFDSDWLYQPTFIASFDVDDSVLFFMKEKSLEQVAEGQDLVYSRVVRICKNDMGAINLGNQWTSLRKVRLTCIYNNTYLNELESVIRVNDDLFVASFSLKLPGSNSVSFLCEFQKQALVSSLSLPANNFKELVPGTQYWSKISPDKVPKNVPSQCNYNSMQLKDEALNFLRSHCLIGDYVEGTMTHFVNSLVKSIAIDSVALANAHMVNGKEINSAYVYYLGTADGRVAKTSNIDSSIISEWKIANEAITEMAIKPGTWLYMATELAMYQVAVSQCHHYSICSVCMTDPYCGWNVRLNVCEDTRINSNVVSLNPGMCSRFQKQDTVKLVQVESGLNIVLECNVNDDYLQRRIEWHKDQQPIDFFEKKFILASNKDLIILSGNSTQDGVYSCIYDKTELVASYSLNYRPASTKVDAKGVSTIQKCITAEKYIKQYNNWCDEFYRYHKALSEWEDLKEKSCSSATLSSASTNPGKK